MEMQFLADVDSVCEECRGRRFKSTILEILCTKARISTTCCR